MGQYQTHALLECWMRSATELYRWMTRQWTGPAIRLVRLLLARLVKNI